MNAEAARNIILRAASYFKTQNAGYQSWGEVKVLQIAVRIEPAGILSTDENKYVDVVGPEDIRINAAPAFIQQIFYKRKDVGVILITQQRYASKIKTEIPPILDDQAQLLGVSVRVAGTQDDIVRSLKGRFAAILPDGNSICLGSNIEEAFVAAQLLEKTSKAFIEAEVLGGAKPINRIEAWLMQKFYQFKYSKEAKKNK
jgi:vacuolar-type H+-ATPase subunit F/Vma7